MIISQPGIYPDVSNEDYHKSAGISSSGLSALLECPKNYWYKYLSGQYEAPDNKNFAMGTAVHTLSLEPETFGERFFITKIPRKRTKSFEAAMLEISKLANDRELISPKDYQTALDMASALSSHKFFKSIGNGCIEHSLAWIDEESGALLRSRPDFYNDNFVVDVKTSRDVSPSEFARSMFKFGYHRQAAMACDGLTKLTGREYSSVILFVVSKEPPHLVKSYLIGAESLEIGRKQYKDGAFVYQECLVLNNWPGYPEIVEDLEIPKWAIQEYNYRSLLDD